MKKMKFITYFLVLFLFGYVCSCTKMDDYKKNIHGGEIRYTGKVDSIIVHPGYERIELTMILGSDPSVAKVKVYWNNGNDSAEMNVNKTAGEDTINMFIKNLNEQTYNFTAYTYDDKGHSSVATHASGTAYGKDYQNSLVGRKLKSLEQAPAGGSVIINWSEADKGEVGTILRYQDSTGSEQKLVVPPSQMVTELTGYKENSLLYYQSSYLPDSTAIDTLSVTAFSINLPAFERQLNKADFQALNLPTDAQDCCGWSIQHLWDGSYGTPGYAARHPAIPNQWFAIDLGESTQLSRFKTWQAPDRLYEKQSIKKFEIWGSNNPDPNGSWASWTKLLTCVSVKPSGLPLGQTTEEDIAYAKAGEEFIFPDTIPSVRYIRIKVLETWGGSNWSTMAELTFWTRDH